MNFRRPWLALVGAGVLGAVILPGAFAQVGAPNPPPAATPTPLVVDGAGAMLPYFLVLLLMVAAGFFVLRGQWPLRLGRATGGARKLQIAEMRPLGNRQFLVVVDYDGAKMLLGVTPGRIDHLCALEDRSAPGADFASLVPPKPEP